MTADVEPRGPIDWLFRNRRTGAITIVQAPSLPLWIFLAATAARLILRPEGILAGALSFAATVVLLWWSIAEIRSGVNPFRRGLGAVVLVFAILRVLNG